MTVRTVTERGVSTLEISRMEKGNALTAAMYLALAEGLEAAAADPGVRAVLITGQPGMFTAGNDIGDFQSGVTAEPGSPALRFMRALHDCELPVIAAVDGPAIGIGATLLLHCDLVYLSDRARLGLPFVGLGLVPEFASSLLLPQRIGRVRAAEKLLLCEPIGAPEALELGLANAVLPAGELLGHARAVAERFLALPPHAVRATKRLLRAAAMEGIERALAAENALFAECLRNPETQRTLQTLLQRRRPDPGAR